MQPGADLSMYSPGGNVLVDDDMSNPMMDSDYPHPFVSNNSTLSHLYEVIIEWDDAAENVIERFYATRHLLVLIESFYEA